MCVPVGYEAWAFYSIGAVLTAAYFFLLARILTLARSQAVDSTPYQGSILLIGPGVYGPAGFKMRHPSTADADLQLFARTKQRLAFLSLGCSVIGVVAITAILHCHLPLRKAALRFAVGVAQS
jgi:hypothetical protein